MICRECGAILPVDTTLCDNCGCCRGICTGCGEEDCPNRLVDDEDRSRGPRARRNA